MLLRRLETALWGEICWLVAAGPGQPALVVDPGLGAVDAVGRVCRDNDLTVAGVLASHGHVDHVADAARLADQWRVPVWIHPAERDLLTDPTQGLDPAARALVGDLMGVGDRVAEPHRVIELADGQVLDLAGYAVTVLHAPGHRPGCVIFRVPIGDQTVAFTGDVLFAGTIGRTDLPGGSRAQMVASLRDVVLGAAGDGRLHLPLDTIVLPGHGPRTVMAVERSTNPYLQADFLEAPA